MEGGKQTGSSFTSAHFDPKDAAAGILGAIFAPPAKWFWLFQGFSWKTLSMEFACKSKTLRGNRQLYSIWDFSYADILGRESLHSFEAARTYDYFNQDLNAKPAVPAPEEKTPSTNCQCNGQSRRSLDCLLFLPEEKVKPFPYSSSIYYGGQDFYVSSESTKEALTTFTKEEGEDDSGSATRGNWWQGSLYY